MDPQTPPRALLSVSNNEDCSPPSYDWLERVARQHRANFDLWHIEDEARSPGASDATIADVKRRIDRTNQQRNDQAEELDRTLVKWLLIRNCPIPTLCSAPIARSDHRSAFHSRIKIYHTREETERPDASEGHILRNRGRLDILEVQRDDLAGCLDALWQETLSGSRSFKLYRQMKMYNDPSLNPSIYRNQP